MTQLRLLLMAKQAKMGVQVPEISRAAQHSRTHCVMTANDKITCTTKAAMAIMARRPLFSSLVLMLYCALGSLGYKPRGSNLQRHNVDECDGTLVVCHDTYVRS